MPQNKSIKNTKSTSEPVKKEGGSKHKTKKKSYNNTNINTKKKTIPEYLRRLGL